MIDLVKAVLQSGWPLLASAAGVLVVGRAILGFFPGVVNRLFARSYAKEDPRRAEMIAELYEVPRKEQWWWVFQQGERALFEGLPARAVRARTLPISSSWSWNDQGHLAIARLWYKRRVATSAAEITEIARKDLETFRQHFKFVDDGVYIRVRRSGKLLRRWSVTIEAYARSTNAPPVPVYLVNVRALGDTQRMTTVEVKGRLR